MTDRIQIVGAGIGGLTLAIALARKGCVVEVTEQAKSPSPVGAGIQLGPNATRVLVGLGLLDRIKSVATNVIKTTTSGLKHIKVNAKLPLQANAAAPWLCIHRAELHAQLLSAATALGVPVYWGKPFNAAQAEASRLVAADGLWSAVRAASGDASLPQPTGHWAWRCLLPRTAVPQAWLGAAVTACFAHKCHLVMYPVQLAGVAMLNVVAFTPSGSIDARDVRWAQPTTAQALLEALGELDARLADAIRQAPSITRWTVAARPPLTSARAMLCELHGQTVPLLGDAAHPMRPYAAQGAAMAIEDAAVLAVCIEHQSDWQTACQTYAQTRWQRNARVQAYAMRNGRIFHLPPPLSWARDAALALYPSLMRNRWVTELVE